MAAGLRNVIARRVIGYIGKFAAARIESKIAIDMVDDKSSPAVSASTPTCSSDSPFLLAVSVNLMIPCPLVDTEVRC